MMIKLRNSILCLLLAAAGMLTAGCRQTENSDAYADSPSPAADLYSVPDGYRTSTSDIGDIADTTAAADTDAAPTGDSAETADTRRTEYPESDRSVTEPAAEADETAAVTEQLSLAEGESVLWQPMRAKTLDDVPAAEETEPDDTADTVSCDTDSGTPNPSVPSEADTAAMYDTDLQDDALARKQAEIEEQSEIRQQRREAEEEAERQWQAVLAAIEEKRAAERAAIEAQKAKEALEAAKKAACPGYNADYVAALTEEEQKEAEYFYEQGYVFYRQNWSVTKELPYGDEGFGQCGCGPTCAAAIISNLAGVSVTPEDMRVYGIEHNSYIPNVGTTYDFLMTVTAAYGIRATNAASKSAVIEALKAGKLVLVTMGPGDFTLGAHFMLYRGVTDEGKILIADSYSFELSAKEWDWDDLERQLKNGYWIFEKET
ncbi:MAG: C39 family peptidase [Eubacteriales bacterium]